MATFSGECDIGAVVADIGSFATKIGFAGEDVPRAYLATAVGQEVPPEGDDAPAPREKRARTEAAAASSARARQYRCGVELLAHSPPLPDSGAGAAGGSSVSASSSSNNSNTLMDIVEPVGVDGLVRDWDALEALWSHAAESYLAVDAVDHPVLLAERPYAPRSARARAAELLFEALGAPSAFFAKDATLACFACGRSSGLVLDLGASGSVATPVHDGWSEARAVVRSAVGTRAVERYLVALLAARRAPLRPRFAARYAARVAPPFGPDGGADTGARELSATASAALATAAAAASSGARPSYVDYMSLETARDLKESACQVASEPVVDSDPRFANAPPTQYELPDGTRVDLGIERFKATELLFDPAPLLVAAASGSLPTATLASVAGGAPCATDATTIGACDAASAAALRQIAAALDAEPPAGVHASRAAAPQMLCTAAFKCERELHATLLGNVVLAGGGSAFEGTPERLHGALEDVVREHAPAGWRVKVASAGGGAERRIAAWLGGSILASLGSFHEMWVAKAEYEEHGHTILDRKCP